MMFRYAFILSMLAVLPYRPALADNSAFMALYVPQYVTTTIKTSDIQYDTGKYRSGAYGFYGGGFTGSWFWEMDGSALFTLLQELNDDGDGRVDGGVFNLRLGHALFGEKPTIGWAAILDFHALGGVPDAGWLGAPGLMVFGAIDVDEKLYFLPKIGYIKTGFGEDAPVSGSFFMECGIGYRLAGYFGVMIQPSLDFRSIRDGSANRFALRLGLGALN